MAFLSACRASRVTSPSGAAPRKRCAKQISGHYSRKRLLERISSLAQALGAARELVTIFRALRDFTVVSVPCDGLFISLYDPILDVRVACYG